MFSFLNYNFCKDGNCLDSLAPIADNITTVQIQNGIFDHFNVTRDVTNPYSSTPPTVWDYLTIMDANFNGNINAGNVDFTAGMITSLKIKRREVGTFNWITLKEIPVVNAQSLIFNILDYIALNNTNYEYAFVPTLNETEGNYVTNQVFSQFNGVFICDSNSIYKFYAGASYGNGTQVQKVGVFEPFGRQYPVVVSNALTNYYQGSVSGTILNDEFYVDGTIDREKIVEKRKQLTEFLTNKKPKVLKDWNGNMWLMAVADAPKISYTNSYGMGIATVDFSFVETGNAENGKDLANNGLIDRGD